jgi:hypothetical protein
MTSSTVGTSDSFNVRRELDREMGHGEKVLWSGRPVQGIRLQKGDAVGIPFSLFWGGFAMFWVASAYRSGAPWFFVLFGVPFVLIGLYLIAGRFFYDAWQRARIYYGVSSKRVLIVHGAKSRRVTSLDLESLGEVTFTENANGGGSLQFGRDSVYGANLVGTGWPGTRGHLAPRFDLAEDARRVYDLIRKAQSDAR